jgi:DNA-binding response OmpR family regulator
LIAGADGSWCRLQIPQSWAGVPLALIGAHCPDLIVLDLLLPGVDGWAVLLACRQQPAVVEVPVLVLSGVSGAKAQAERLGAQEGLDKPFDLDDLVQRVHALLPSVA